MSLLIRLYPKAWRERYGEEFAEILADRPLGPFDVVDVVLGALDAHLHRRAMHAASHQRKGSLRSLRVGGYAAITGGILWLLVFLASVLTPNLGSTGFLAILLATVLLLIALTSLSAFQARRSPALIWVAFLVPAFGACVSMVGVIAMLVVGDRPFVGDASPWYVWMLGVAGLMVGSGLFAIATWRVGTLPRPAAALLAVGAMAVIPALSGVFGSTVSEQVGRGLTLLAMVAFSGGWAALGVGALRSDGAASAQLTASTS